MPRRRSIFRLACGLVFGLQLVSATAAEPPVKAPMTATAVERMFAAMKNPVPPRHLLANLYYVGTSGVSSFLFTTPEGHILIDTGFEDTAPLVQRSIEQLGFKATDIKIILSSHAHVDHVGGHAWMKKLTGAQVFASAEDARVLESGGANDFLPFPAASRIFSPVKVDRIVADGETVRLGGTVLTAQLTPGHTRGATTWTIDLSDDGKVYHVVFFCSTTLNPGTSLVLHPSYPGIVRDYETTFARLKALPCDIFFAPHGGQFAMADKFARLDRNEKPNPFIDPAGWQALLAAAENAFRDQLAAEKAAAR